MEKSNKTTLDVRVFSSDGKPVDEKSLTKEQINFCAKLAARKYRLFSASKVRKFDAESESIDVTLPEDIENVDIEQMAQEAAEARDAELAPEEVVTEVTEEPEIVDEPEPEPELTPAEEAKEMCKEFASSLKRFARRMRKFSEEEIEEVKEELKDVLDTVEEIVDEHEDEPEMIDQVKEFTAKLRKFNKTRKFSSEDLEEVEKLEDELEKAIDKDPEIIVEEPETEVHRDGVKDLKEFAAAKIDQIAGSDSIDNFKAQFFASCKK